MSVNVYDPVNDKLIPVAGATLYADTPIGAIQAFDSTDIPSSFLEFKGQTVNRADYPDLWAHIVKNNLFGEGKFYGIGDGATTFTLADLRETSLKGYGETSRSVGAHVKSGGLGIGEFIDDRNKKHNHRITVFGSDERSFYLSGGSDSGDNLSSGAYNTADYSRLLDVTNQGGDTTEVKAVGVVWAVKAKQTGLPIDFQQQMENYVDENLLIESYTSPVITMRSLMYGEFDAMHDTKSGYVRAGMWTEHTGGDAILTTLHRLGGKVRCTYYNVASIEQSMSITVKVLWKKV